MCEVYNADGTPSSTNARHTIYNTVNKFDDDTDDFRFGFEQEYVLAKNGRPLGFPEGGYPAPQGKYYCGVGADTMVGEYANERIVAREIVERHLDICLDAGLVIDCINAEVLRGQREYGVLSKGAEKAGDDVWLARYIMIRLCEEYGVTMVLTPKPITEGDWNGTGMHCNFSNRKMREEGGEKYFTKICETFGKHIKEHMDVYGSGNEKRLTGLHETQRIDQFSYGVSDRGASIRIPLATVRNGWKGRLEDRRVAANADPYKVVARVVKTVMEADKSK